MKRCTYCGKGHPDEATVCSLDQQPLELITSPSTTTKSSDLQPSKGWPPQIVVPAVLWLVVNFLLVGLFTFGASFLFGLLTALWAAIDCSRLRSKGSRVLGIAFKPFVVFAVVAFFLWGFGFIWYLVMRNRVKTAPIDLERENATARPTETWKCQKCGEANPMGFDSCWNCSSGGRPEVIIPEGTETPFPGFSRGGNPWE
ncbi:MAG: hypothetical protein U1F83_10720 [Verrucomicrobiota bacterium]